jgi:PhnB protein
MSKDTSPVPSGFHSVTPSLTVKDAKAALAFYAKAFGAVERMRIEDPKSGKIAHAEFTIGDSTLMISDEYPAFGAFAPEFGKGALFMIYVKDVAGVFAQAINAGAKELMPPTDQFWGDRSGRVADPFGYRWTVAQRMRDVPPEEIAKTAAAMFG